MGTTTWTPACGARVRIFCGIELGTTDIMVERQLSDAVRRYVRIMSSDEDPPVFVMSYGDNDMDSKVYGKREFLLRVVTQFVVDLAPSAAIPRE